ncbi:MAG TPA: hypothetical protein EYM40_04860 [Candidatus Poseidoniales archaeon]|jgi:hypothetical protein|nr:hypothetical protein [Candidatus Poseidoniales archaeon]
MTELIQMRVKALAAILVLTLLMPTAAAHGANTFSFIMRNESIQPDTAQVIQNDTLIFYNTAEHNRTVLIDMDGDGLDDVNCEAGPSDSSSMEDECWVWLDPANWTAGVYEAKLMENGALWSTVEFTIVLDDHTETLSPDDHEHDDHAHDEGGAEGELLSAAVLLAGAAVFVWVIRNVKGDEEE